MNGWLRHGGQIAALLAAITLSGCGDSVVSDDETQPAKAPQIPRLLSAEEALQGAHIPSADPAGMVEAEIRKGLGGPAHCTFHYTNAGEPVLAMDIEAADASAAGVVKINGSLVRLQMPADASTDEPDRLLLRAGEVRLTVSPDPRIVGGNGEPVESLDTTFIFEIGEELKAGYRGYMGCTSRPASAATS